jgi:hypothetical protein
VNLTGDVTVKTAAGKDKGRLAIGQKSVIPEAEQAAPE